MLRRSAWIASVYLGVLSGCSPTNDVGSCATEAQVVAKVFKPKCGGSGCHSPGEGANAPFNDLDLISPGVAGRLVNGESQSCTDPPLPGTTEYRPKKLLVPGNVAESYLRHKVTADIQPQCGERMPVSERALTDGEIACIDEFIRTVKPGASSGDGGVGADGAVEDTAPPIQCASGLVDCGGVCTDTNSSVANCGACGKACPSGQVCAAGACSSTCPAATTNCSGSCVDVMTNAMNCGVCGTACAGGETCSGGKCACPGGTTSCSGKCTDLQTDLANCGACGKACPAGLQCAAGACSCGAVVSFAADVQPIFTASCNDSGCHAGTRPGGNLLLTTGNSYKQLVNVPSSSCGGKIRVVPSRVDTSYLENKLTGVGMCSGTQMPKKGVSLAAANLAKIRSWICSGAKND